MNRRLPVRSAIRNSARSALALGLLSSGLLFFGLLLFPRASAAALGTPVFEWQRCPSSY